MNSAPHNVGATFWLLDAPDSLDAQSRTEPDGVGLGYFDTQGRAHVHRKALAAFEDVQFEREAKTARAQTFIAHVRYASTGGLETRNTHPFLQHERLFAHNGVILGLDKLDEELGPYGDLVKGETDSERYFALITKYIDMRDGDVKAGITDATKWIAANLPVFALNIVLTTATELWALRYPDTHPLYVLERAAGPPHGAEHLQHKGTKGRMRLRAPDLRTNDAVVVASERMDSNQHWRLLQSGELIHVNAIGESSTEQVVTDMPHYPVTLADLHPQAAASQGA